MLGVPVVHEETMQINEQISNSAETSLAAVRANGVIMLLPTKDTNNVDYFSLNPHPSVVALFFFFIKNCTLFNRHLALRKYCLLLLLFQYIDAELRAAENSISG